MFFCEYTVIFFRGCDLVYFHPHAIPVLTRKNVPGGLHISFNTLSGTKPQILTPIR